MFTSMLKSYMEMKVIENLSDVCDIERLTLCILINKMSHLIALLLPQFIKFSVTQKEQGMVWTASTE